MQLKAIAAAPVHNDFLKQRPGVQVQGYTVHQVKVFIRNVQKVLPVHGRKMFQRRLCTAVVVDFVKVLADLVIRKKCHSNTILSMQRYIINLPRNRLSDKGRFLKF